MFFLRLNYIQSLTILVLLAEDLSKAPIIIFTKISNASPSLFLDANLEAPSMSTSTPERVPFFPLPIYVLPEKEKGVNR